MSSFSLSILTRFKEYRFSIYLLLLIPFLLFCDYLITLTNIFNNAFLGVLDNFIHGLVAVYVLYPFYRKYDLKTIIVVFLIASLIDIDHFVALRTISIYEAVEMLLRPATHSLSFVFTCSLIAWLISKRDFGVFWLFFAALSSHIIRDAATGGYTQLFYPAEIFDIPYRIYIISELSLFGVSFFIKGHL